MAKLGICFKNDKGQFLRGMGDFPVLNWVDNPAEAHLFDVIGANELAALLGHCMFIGVIRVGIRRAILIETATGFYVRDDKEVRKCRTLKAC